MFRTALRKLIIWAITDPNSGEVPEIKAVKVTITSLVENLYINDVKATAKVVASHLKKAIELAHSSKSKF